MQLLCESDLKEVTPSDLEEWVNVESNEEVQEGMIEDAIELDDLEMESEPRTAAVMEGEKDDDGGPKVSSTTLPASSEDTEIFADLE